MECLSSASLDLSSSFFFFSSIRRHTRCLSDWSSDVCSSDLKAPDLVAKTIVPDIPLMPAHQAVLDFEFYAAKQFPAEYRDGAFLALHGSWNRSKRVGYAIAFIPFRNGKPSGPPRDFLTGWMISPDSRDVWGRPVG